MKEKDRYNPVAVACGVEYEDSDGSVFLVFKIIDEKFKRKIKKDWTQDIDLKIVDKSLYEFNDE